MKFFLQVAFQEFLNHKRFHIFKLFLVSWSFNIMLKVKPFLLNSICKSINGKIYFTYLQQKIYFIDIQSTFFFKETFLHYKCIKKFIINYKDCILIAAFYILF